MRMLVDDNMSFVTHTLRRAGVPRSDVDDQVQRTFVVAARKLEDIQVGAERQFLYQVAIHTALHARRDIARRREVMPQNGPPDRIEADATPERLTEQKQIHDLLVQIVEGIPEPLRRVLILHMVEEKTTNEIAALLGVARGTIASRLRRARAHVCALVDAVELAWDCGIESVKLKDVWRKNVSTFEHALLRAGTFAPPTAGARAKTLALLGLVAAADS